jgi:hypothetical protein
MARLTKAERRRIRERKATIKAKKKARREGRQEPWKPVKMELYEVPNPFPEGLSFEERLEIVRTVGEKSKQELDRLYPTLEDWFKQYDALYLLSFCLTYFTTHPEGTDPEAEGRLEFPEYFLELLQAFALGTGRSISSKPLMGEAARLKSDLRQIGDLIGRTLLAFPESIDSEAKAKEHSFRSSMMGHTIAVRNWAYHSQMRRVTLDLATRIEARFEEVFHCDPARFIRSLFALTEGVNERLNNHRNKVRAVLKERDHVRMYRSYIKVFPHISNTGDDEADALWEMCGKDLRNFQMLLLAHSDLALADLYTFTLEDLYAAYGDTPDHDALVALLDKLSHRFGDLAGANMEHFVLDNPILRKPFIRLDDGRYFTSVWSMIPNVSLGLLEDLMDEEKSLREHYFDVKASYLESEVETLFKSRFDPAQVLRGSQWTDPATGVQYENDLTVLAPPFAFVVEAKSGGLSRAARRGAPRTLFDDLRKLVEEPSEQAYRFIDFLQSQKQPIVLLNKQGETHRVDPTVISYYVPLSVTLEQLGTISSNLKKLRDAGVTARPMSRLALSMNLTDLQCVFELLGSEAEIIHYLARRKEFENHVEYEGDELDLLAFYLENGFNIGPTEFDERQPMVLLLKSKELDPYFEGQPVGRRVTKPRRALTPWWEAILERLGRLKMAGWREGSYILLSTSREDQADFERAFHERAALVASGKAEHKHNWVIMTVGPRQRQFFIAGYPYTDVEHAVRHDILETILSEDEAKASRGAFGICVNLDRKNYPYNFAGGTLNKALFDPTDGD